MKTVPMDYRHLKSMTDATGMLQFARLNTPDPESGYTGDDNARALLVALDMKEQERPELVRTYVRFLETARRSDGGWCNWKLDGRFVSTIDSDDSQGRIFLACCAASLCDLDDVRESGRRMALRALPALTRVKEPRSVAYALLGICKNPGLSNRKRELLASAARDFADYLIQLYDSNKSPGWLWFEQLLTYCNGILPHALFAYYSMTQDRKALRVARETMGWLSEALFARGYLNIVGNRGWWHQGKAIPCYDQQPVDACSMALACAQAFQATGDDQYRSLAELAHSWYRGNNINRVSLYDTASGGCYDALVPEGVNLNQGAEAVLSSLLSQQAVDDLMLAAPGPEASEQLEILEKA